MNNMKIDIPFSNKYILFEISKGSSLCYGNGHKHITLSISLMTILGSGDDGNRLQTPIKLK